MLIFECISLIPLPPLREEAVTSSIDSCIRFWDLDTGEQTAVVEPGPGEHAHTVVGEWPSYGIAPRMVRNDVVKVGSSLEDCYQYHGIVR